MRGSSSREPAALERDAGFLRRLIAGVAHDLSDVFTALEGQVAAETLPKSPFSQIDLARESVRRGARLVRHLSGFGCARSVESGPVNLTSLLLDRRELLESLLDGSALVDVHTETPDAWVFGNEHQLERLVLRLCLTAGHSMAAGDLLSIRLTRGAGGTRAGDAAQEFPFGEHVLVEVSKEIKAQDEYAVAPALRLRRWNADFGFEVETLSRQVEDAEGRLHIVNSDAFAPVFRMYLPLCAGPVPLEVRDGQFVNPFTHSEAALVVDDDKGVREYIGSILEAAGFTVAQKADASGAILWASERDRRIDLLLADVALRRYSGLELYVELKAKHPDVTAVFLSGFPRSEVMERFSLPEEEAFLQKPFLRDELLVAVRKVLNRRWRILVVDDDPRICEIVSSALLTGGYRNPRRASGQDAIRILQREVFDLVILDLYMAGHDGFEVLQFLRGQGCSSKVLVISAAPGVLLRAAHTLGADAVLAKPFSPQAFLDAANQVTSTSTFSAERIAAKPLARPGAEPTNGNSYGN